MDPGIQKTENGALNVVRGVGAAFKDKKKWIPALILAAVWFALTLLPIMVTERSAAALGLAFYQGGLWRKVRNTKEVDIT